MKVRRFTLYGYSERYRPSLPTDQTLEVVEASAYDAMVAWANAMPRRWTGEGENDPEFAWWNDRPCKPALPEQATEER